jgi:hypothetical protein
MGRIRTRVWFGLGLLMIVAAGGAGLRAQDSAAVTAGKHGPMYVNRQYRFKLMLPPGWKGYSVVTSEWSGAPLKDGVSAASGPQLTFRHPKWTEANPYQDIPIMVFTKAQWAHIDDLAVSAAPFPPSKIAENAQYVLALPPRWAGFAEVLGSDVVGKWMATQRLHAY